MKILVIVLTLFLAAHSAILDIGDSTFSSLVSSNPEQLWMIMFGAEWCKHCQEMKPEFEKTSNEMRDYGIKFGYVNEKGNNMLVGKYVADPHTHMVSYPKIVVILGEEVVGEVPGHYRNSHAFKFWFDNTFTIQKEL